MDIDWDAMVERAVEALPPQFREKISNVALLIEDEPDKGVREREGLARDETLLGLYHGIPLSLRGDGYGIGETLPDTITLYKKPILELAGHDPEAVQRVVTETVWHEFGHYFGLDEEEVQKREAQKFQKRD